MDPILKSTLTSVLMTGAGSLATVAVTNGVIPGSEHDSAANIIVSLMLWAITAGIGWYKRQQHTPQANLDAINVPKNGLKVVPDMSPTPAVLVAPKSN